MSRSNHRIWFPTHRSTTESPQHYHSIPTTVPLCPTVRVDVAALTGESQNRSKILNRARTTNKMASVPEKVEQLLEKLEKLDAAKPKAARLYERLEALLVLTPMGLGPVLQCEIGIENSGEHVECLERAFGVLRHKHGADLKIMLGVVFTARQLAFCRANVAAIQAWRELQQDVRSRACIYDVVPCSEGVILNSETLTAEQAVQRHEKRCVQVDEVRFKDLQISLETKSVQKLSCLGHVQRSGTKLMLLNGDEIIGPGYDPEVYAHVFPKINYQIAECNNFECENIRDMCHLRCACKTVRYCSKDCQRQHWPIHKHTCTSRRS